MERFIEIDGQKIPVSEEVYQAYKRPAWRERKQTLKFAGEGVEAPLSIEQMLEDGVDIPYYGPTVEQIVMLKLMMEELHRAMEQLPLIDRILMEMIAEGVSDREICRKTGIPRATFSRRKESLIRNLRDTIVNNL